MGYVIFKGRETMLFSHILHVKKQSECMMAKATFVTFVPKKNKT